MSLRFQKIFVFFFFYTSTITSKMSHLLQTHFRRGRSSCFLTPKIRLVSVFSNWYERASFLAHEIRFSSTNIEIFLDGVSHLWTRPYLIWLEASICTERKHFLYDYLKTHHAEHSKKILPFFNPFIMATLMNQGGQGFEMISFYFQTFWLKKTSLAF